MILIIQKNFSNHQNIPPAHEVQQPPNSGKLKEIPDLYKQYASFKKKIQDTRTNTVI